MSDQMQQRPDGTWGPAESLRPQGPAARVEAWLRRRGWVRLANKLAWWDERAS